MSKTFITTLGVIVALSIAAFVYHNLQKEAFQNKSSPYKSLNDARDSGQVEQRSFDDWQKSNGGGDAFKAWREAELAKRKKIEQASPK